MIIEKYKPKNKYKQEYRVLEVNLAPPQKV